MFPANIKPEFKSGKPDLQRLYKKLGDFFKKYLKYVLNFFEKFKITLEIGTFDFISVPKNCKVNSVVLFGQKITKP